MFPPFPRRTLLAATALAAAIISPEAVFAATNVLIGTGGAGGTNGTNGNNAGGSGGIGGGGGGGSTTFHAGGAGGGDGAGTASGSGVTDSGGAAIQPDALSGDHVTFSTSQTIDGRLGIGGGGGGGGGAYGTTDGSDGVAGTDGTLTINNGATVSVGNNIIVGGSGGGGGGATSGANTSAGGDGGSGGSGTLILSGASLTSGNRIILGGSAGLNGNGPTAGGAAGAAGLGTLTISGTENTLSATHGITVNTNGSIIFGQSDTLTFTSAISNAGTISQSGTGTTVLTGAVTGTGTTTISSGALHIGNGGTTGSIEGNIFTSTAIVFNRSDAVTYAGGIFGPGTLTKSGSGTLTITGSNTNGGGTTINAGTLALSGAGSISQQQLVVNTGGVLDISGRTASSTLIGALSGTGGGVVLGGKTLERGGPLDSTYSGVISGTGSFTKSGGGTQTLTGINTYSGLTTINAGTLALSGGGALNPYGTVLLGAGATFDISGVTAADIAVGSLSGAGTVAIGAKNLFIVGGQNNAYAGNISGTGSFIKSGGGTQTFTGINTYTGGTTINAGTLALSGGGALGATAALHLNTGAIFNISGITASGVAIGSLSGGGNVVLGGKNITVGDTSDTAYSGVISGTGSFTKSGAGKLTLTGNNTYSGGTIITGGTLALTPGSGAAGTGAITIDSVGTLALQSVSGAGNSSSATIAGTGTLTVSGPEKIILAGNASAFTGTLAIDAPGLATGGSLNAATIALASGATLESTVAQNANTTISGAISGAGGVLLSGTGTLVLSGANTHSGGTVVNAGTLVSDNASALGSGAVVVMEGGTLRLDTTTSGTASLLLDGGDITGAGTLNTAGIELRSGTVAASLAVSNASTVHKTDAGTVTLSGDNVFVGGLSVDAGELIAESAGALGGGLVTVNSGATLTANAAVAGISGLVLDGGTLAGTGSITTGTFELRSGTVAVDIHVTGASAVTVTGGDTLTLDSAVSGIATLTLDDGTLNGSGSVAANTFDLRNGTVSLRLTGSGQLVKTDGGTVVLATDSDFTGGTTILAGTLSVQNAGALGSGSVVVSGGALKLDTGVVTTGTVTLESGSLEGSGSLTAGAYALRSGTVSVALDGGASLVKTTGGTVVLSSENHHTGGTTVNAGTLSVQNAGALGSGPVVVSGGALRLDTGVVTSGAVTLDSGSLEGSGSLTAGAYALRSGTVSVALDGGASLVKSTGGTVVLASENHYTGGTAVNAGTLSVQNAGALGSGPVVVNSGATLEANAPDGSAFANTLSGAGVFIRNSPGVLTLSGNNSGFTGTTSAASGTLVVSSGSVSSGDYSANSGATVRFSGATLNHDLAGTGAYEFSGNNTFSGTKTGTGSATLLSGATLDLGDLAAPSHQDNLALILASGATLSGSGYMRSLRSDGGRIAPGRSPGQFTITGGDVTLNAGILDVEIAGTGAGQFDKISYTGNAVINGATLHIAHIGGYTPQVGDSVRFLEDTSPDAGLSVLGSGFGTINQPTLAGGISSRLVIDANGAYFEYFRATLTTIPGYSPHGGLAGFVDALPLNPVAFDAFVALNTSGGPAAMNRALTAASPIGLSGQEALVLDETRSTARMLRDRAEDRLTGDQWQGFVTGRGAVTDWKSDSDNGTFDHNFGGGSGGLARAVGSSGLSVGLAAGYDSGRADLHDGAGKLEQDRGSVTAYTAYSYSENGYVYGGVTGGYSAWDTKRTHLLGTDKGDTDGFDVSATFGAGHRIRLGDRFDTTPYAALTYLWSRTEGFSESGTALALNVKGREYESLRARIGDDFGWTIPAGSQSLRLSLGVAYERELLDDDVAFRSAFAAGQAFRTRGEVLSKDVISVTPAVSWNFTAAQSVRFGYSYEYGFQGTTSNRFDAAYTVKF